MRNSKLAVSLFSVFLFFLLSSASSAWGVTVTWNGASDGVTWTDDDNWDTLRAPVEGDDVVMADLGAAYTVNYNGTTSFNSLTIENGSTLVLFSGPRTVTTLDINSGGTLDLYGVLFATTITVNGTLNFGGGTLYTETVSGAGTLNWTDGTLFGGTYDLDNFTIATDVEGLCTIEGNLTNDGTINWDSGEIQLINGGQFRNQGTFNIVSDAMIYDDLSSELVRNVGTVVKSGSTGTTAFQVTSFNDATGTIDVQTGTLAFTGSSITNSGTLQGTGTIDVSGTSGAQDGAVRPGTSPGVLNWTGNYGSSTAATLHIELGGTNPGNTATDHDQFKISGAATLAGTLNVSLYGFTPTQGNTFNIATYGSRTGQFNTVNLPDLSGSGLDWDVAYNTTDVTLTVVGVPGSNECGAQWYLKGPQDGTQVQSILCSGTTVLAGTQGGIYRTTDNGTSWGLEGLRFRDIEALLDDTECSGLLLAGAYNDIYSSADGGASWQFLTNLNDDVNALARSSVASCIGYIGTDNGVYVSNENYGLAGKDIRALAVDSSDNVYAATERDGLWKSADNGATWTKLVNLPDVHVEELLIDGLDNIYAATIFAGVQRSTNGGTDWSAFGTGLPVVADAAGPAVTSLAMDSSNTLYAGVVTDIFPQAGAVYSLASESTVWQSTGNAVNDLGGDALCVTTSDLLYAGTNAGMFQYNGTAWIDQRSGIDAVSFSESRFVQNASGVLFVGSDGGGIYTSLDSGQTWNSVNGGPWMVDDMLIDSAGILYAASDGPGGVYRSTDNGASWTPVNNGLPFHPDYGQPVLMSGGSLALDGNGRIYLGLDDGNVWYTDDQGANWNPSSALPFAAGPDEINAMLGYSASTVFAGTDDEGIFKSADGGATWQAVNTGLPAFPGIIENSFSVDPSNNDIYVGLWNDGGLYRSQDSGESWAEVTVDPNQPWCDVRSLTMDRSGDNMFATVCSGAVYVSLDHGNNWSDMSDGLMPWNNVDGIQISRVFLDANHNLLASSGSGGIYKTHTTPTIDGAFLWTDNCPADGPLDCQGWTLFRGLVVDDTCRIDGYDVSGVSTPDMGDNPFDMTPMFGNGLPIYHSRVSYTGDWTDGKIDLTASSQVSGDTPPEPSHTIDSGVVRQLSLPDGLTLSGTLLTPTFSYNTGAEKPESYEMWIWDVTENMPYLVHISDSLDFTEGTAPDNVAFTVPANVLESDRQYLFQANKIDIDQTESNDPARTYLRIENRSLAYLEYQTTAADQTLTVTKTGTGTGVVTVNSGTLSWVGDTGTAVYVNGTQVRLTAAQDAGSYFTGWSGDCTDIGDSLADVTMDADKNCTASFCLDDDGDSVCNAVDACTGDDFSGDTDNDGICDDQDACTDVDNDTYCAELDDCDDSDGAINPGSIETCDGIDNNCDGQVDENLTQATSCGVGACSGNTGVETCTAGTWGGGDTCDPLAGAGADDATCDGVDDDCDGVADEDYVSIDTNCGVGACGSTGATSCVAGAVVDSCTAGTPVAETCDGVDNNCDGQLDEGLGQTTCGLGACEHTVDNCVGGVAQSCDAMEGAAVDDATCDGIDDDCNGTVDEDYVTSPTACGVGECASTGQLECQGGAEVDTCTPGAPAVEICDGLDNNCDNEIDEGFDQDADGDADCFDVCPNDADNDIDGDSICGDTDNCPATSNNDQSDIDGDGVGDVCESAATSLGQILIDASRDGGVWWSPQAPPFDPDANHQGKALADYLKSLGYLVTELPSPTTITSALLAPYDLVIRAHESSSYTADEITAYLDYVGSGKKLLLFRGYLRPAETDSLAESFGIVFQGVSRGTNIIDTFIDHPLTAGVSAVAAGIGTGITGSDPSADLLGYYAVDTYLDLDNDSIQDPEEPTGAATLGEMLYGEGRIVFSGSLFLWLGVPQPLVDNTLYWLLNGDYCPDDPDKVDPGICGCGVPDTDFDDEGIPDCNDNCPEEANASQVDTDGDGVGDACDTCSNDPANDIDADGICGDVDNCPVNANSNQSDIDGDGAGDTCDSCPNDPNDDIDADGICGDVDNCPLLANNEQMDSDDDGIGDACEAPETPTPAPESHDGINYPPGADSVTLFASPFEDQSDEDTHRTSDWRMRRADLPYYHPDYDSSFTVDATSEDLDEHVVNGLESGMKYVWQVRYEDSSGQISDWSDETGLMVGTSELDDKALVSPGIELADYSMVSVIVWPDDPSSVGVLGDDMGEYDTDYFRLGIYNPLIGGYISFGPNLMIVPGWAYWLLARNGLEITVDGVPVSILHDIEVQLLYNQNNGDGWNMVAPPNDADYNWLDVQIVVYDDDGNIVFGPTASGDLADPNPYIDTRVWRWENGQYFSDTLLMQRYLGYWVKVKQANVSLRFPVAVQQAMLPGHGTLYAMKMKKFLSRFKKYISTSTAVADGGDSPPLPMGDFSVTPAAAGSDSGGGGGGCFIATAAAGDSHSMEAPLLIKPFGRCMVDLYDTCAEAITDFVAGLEKLSVPEQE